MKAFQIPGQKASTQLRESEKRARNRLPAHNYAYLHAPTGAVFSECLVKDISETGACIILPMAANLPKQIMLRIIGEATPLSASVIWQVDTKCGLEFNDTDSVCSTASASSHGTQVT